MYANVFIKKAVFVQNGKKTSYDVYVLFISINSSTISNEIVYIHKR